MDYEKHRNFEYNEKYFDLENLRKFLYAYFPDYNDFDFVHVAGSKGKGTTCKIVADYLAGSSKVGLFMSPHVLTINERISVNGKDISTQDFARIKKEFERFSDKFFTEKNARRLTFFEELFVIALKYFYEKKCKYIVLEVGLGGRLDATNIVLPKVCGLTLVEKEHTDVLGKTLKKILGEKLGIKKDGVPFVVGRQQKNIEKFLKEKFEKDKNVFFADDFVELINPNFALGYGLLKVLLGEVDEKKFSKMCCDFKIIGRFDERKIAGKNVIFDIAHTPKSIENLVKNLRKKYSNKNFIFVVSVMKDKEISSILRQISEVASKVVFTNANKERGEKAGNLKKIFDEILSVKKRDKKNGKVFFEEKFVVFAKENPVMAFDFVIKNMKKEDIVVVTGSSFLVSEILKRNL
ncbi:MAG: cyanophycin synthetase [Candidatus Peregrinibacteria bacterium]|nr:cyanophycin synthetase [Candidatus Peregrinibacteria bacterium]